MDYIRFFTVKQRVFPNSLNKKINKKANNKIKRLLESFRPLATTCYLLTSTNTEMLHAEQLMAQTKSRHIYSAPKLAVHISLSCGRFSTSSHAALGLHAVARTAQFGGDLHKDAILPGPPGIRTAVSGRMFM